jgi:hypothetical protein
LSNFLVIKSFITYSRDLLINVIVIISTFANNKILYHISDGTLTTDTPTPQSLEIAIINSHYESVYSKTEKGDCEIMTEWHYSSLGDTVGIPPGFPQDF